MVGGSLLTGKSTMKVKTIETFTKNPLSIVRVTTDSGAEGFGQIAPFDADISATILHRKIAPLVLGKDPYALAAINETCIDRNLKFPWSFVCRALGGVDTALWDLRGKIENKSVCELLGGVPRSLGVYGSSMSRSITPEDEAKRLAGLRDSHGFRAFKIRVGTEAGHNKDAWPGRTEQLVPAVRKAIGPEVALMADANSCYTPDKAIEVGKMLEQNRVVHFEEPCPYWEYEWTAQVTKALKVPVAGGEQDNDLAQWRTDDRAAGDGYRPARCVLCRRDHADAAGGADGPPGGDEGRAAFGESVDGDGVFAAPDGRDSQRGQLCRIHHRE